MKRLTLFSLLALSLAPVSKIHAQAITEGDLLVFQAGNSTTTASSGSTPLIIDEFTTAAGQTSPVTSWDISTMTNPLYTSSGGTAGDLTLSDNGTLLSFSGWTSGNSTENHVLGRGAGTLSLSGAYTLAATYTGVSGNTTRGAYSPDGTNWYFADTGGVYTQGGSTPLYSTSIRDITGNGASTFGMETGSGDTAVGNLTPATPNGSTVAYGGLSGVAVDTSGMDYAFASTGTGAGQVDDMLYVIDQPSSNPNLITKYSLVSGSWMPDGDLSLSAKDNLTQIIAEGSSNGDVNLFFTGDPGSGNGNAYVDEIQDNSGFNSTIVDSGSFNLFTEPTAGVQLQGISFAPVPEPGNCVLLGLGAILLAGGRQRARARFGKAWRTHGTHRLPIWNIKINFKNLTLLVAAGVLMAGATKASAQYFTQGDIIVSTYGSLTGTNVITDGATPITLEEFSVSSGASATLVLTDQLPTTGAGGNVGIQGEDGSSSEGTLQLSANDEYLTIGGYDGNAANNGIQAATNSINSTNFAPGTVWGGDTNSTIALAQSSDVDVPRVAATIDGFGNVNTSTTFTGPYNGNNPRAIYSPDGTNFYISGQGLHKKVSGVYTDEGGIFTTTLGTTGTANTTGIYTAVSTRDVTEYGGNLYYSTDQDDKAGQQDGIFGYSGTPTTAQGIGARLTGSSGAIYAGGGFAPMGTGTTVNFSPEDFAFANATTMYVADTGDPKAGGVGDGGIQKWSFLSGSWTLDYTLRSTTLLAGALATGSNAVGETGFEDLAIQVVGNSVDIYAVSYTVGPDGEANGLYGMADSLSNLSGTFAATEPVTELAASPGIDGTSADYNFKGVSFAPVPEPGTWGMAVGGLALLLTLNRARKRT